MNLTITGYLVGVDADRAEVGERVAVTFGVSTRPSGPLARLADLRLVEPDYVSVGVAGAVAVELRDNEDVVLYQWPPSVTGPSHTFTLYAEEDERAEHTCLRTENERLREELRGAVVGIEMVRDGMAAAYTQVRPDEGHRAQNLAGIMENDNLKLGLVVQRLRAALTDHGEDEE